MEKLIVFDSKQGLEFVEIFMLSPNYIFGRLKNSKLSIKDCPAFHIQNRAVIVNADEFFNGEGIESESINSFEKYFNTGTSFNILNTMGESVFNNYEQENITKIFTDDEFEIRYAIFRAIVKIETEKEININDIKIIPMDNELNDDEDDNDDKNFNFN